MLKYSYRMRRILVIIRPSDQRSSFDMNFTLTIVIIDVPSIDIANVDIVLMYVHPIGYALPHQDSGFTFYPASWRSRMNDVT